MFKRVIVTGLVGLFLLVMAGCNSNFTGSSVEVINSSEVELDQPENNQDREEADDNTDEFIESGPSAEEQNIYEDIYDRLNSSENPGRRNTPSEFISPERDPDIYEAWINEMYDLGMAFRERVFRETGSNYSKSVEEISQIYSEVSTWRFENEMTEND